MDLKFYFYIFLSMVFVLGGTYNYFSRREELAAGIFFLGTTIAALFFGFRWFAPPGDAAAQGKGEWPPVLNSCPDFLVLHASGGKKYCIDTAGVAREGGLMRLTNLGTQGNDERYLFDLYTELGGKQRTEKLCEECKTKKVTWEGLWDGIVCSGREPPAPPGNLIAALIPTSTTTAATAAPGPGPAPR